MPDTRIHLGTGHDYYLINNYIYFAVPLIIMGICINETINFISHQDWTGLVVAIVCFIGAAVSLLRITTQGHYYYPLIIVVGISIFVSLVFLILILIQLADSNLGFLDRHNHLSNATACEMEPMEPSNITDTTNNTEMDSESLCYKIWIQDVKSSSTMFGDSLILLVNTMLIRPVTLPDN